SVPSLRNVPGLVALVPFQTPRMRFFVVALDMSRAVPSGFLTAITIGTPTAPSCTSAMICSFPTTRLLCPPSPQLQEVSPLNLQLLQTPPSNRTVWYRSALLCQG